MPKLRANIGLQTQADAEYKRELEGKWWEFFSTQFDRFVGDPLRAATRVGGALETAGDAPYSGITETDLPVGKLFRARSGDSPVGISPSDVVEGVFEGTLWGIPGGTKSVSAVGQIKGLPDKAARAVRKVMQEELRSRGKKPYVLGSLKPEKINDLYSQGLITEAEMMKNLRYGAIDPISDALRGTLYHGRGTLPEGHMLGIKGQEKLGSKITTGIDIPTGEKVLGTNFPAKKTEEVIQDFRIGRPDLRGAREKKLNMGEPTGVSLSLSPRIASRFSRRPNDEFARIMPLYGGPPEDVIINAWTEAGGKVMKEAYLAAAKKIQKSVLATGSEGDIIRFGKIRSNQDFQDFLTGGSTETEFNNLLTKELQAKGYKGILYSPHRFDEFELKLFDPKDALVVDRRKLDKVAAVPHPQGYAHKAHEIEIDPTFKRMGIKPGSMPYNKGEAFGKTQTMKNLAGATQGQPRSLRDWYSEIDVAKELGLRKPEPLAIKGSYDAFVAPEVKKIQLLDQLKKKPLFASEELTLDQIKKITTEFEVGSWEVVDELVNTALDSGAIGSESIYQYVKSELTIGGFKKTLDPSVYLSVKEMKNLQKKFSTEFNLVQELQDEAISKYGKTTTKEIVLHIEDILKNFYGLKGK